MVPLAIALITMVSAGSGVKFMIDAGSNYKKSQKIIDSSNLKKNDYTQYFNKYNKLINIEAEKLGFLKKEVYKKIIKDKFTKIYKKFQNVKLNDLYNSETDFNVILNENDFKQFQIQAAEAVEVAGNILSSAAAGIGVSMGTYALAGYIGSASSGTAITTLSGIAAQNATLAWLGGGALKAGGLGIAGGTALLGGLMAGPALLVGGLYYNMASEKELTEVKKYQAQVNISCEKIKLTVEFLKALNLRINEISRVIKKVTIIFQTAIKELESIDDKFMNKHSYNSCELSLDDKKVLYKTLTIAKNLKKLLEVAIIQKNGVLNNESQKIIYAVKNEYF